MKAQLIGESTGGMTEANNVLEIGLPDLHRSLKDLASEVRRRSGVQGLPRVYFQDAAERYSMLLQANNLGFNVSGALNGATSYQLNRTIFGRYEEIGNIVLKIAAAPARIARPD